MASFHRPQALLFMLTRSRLRRKGIIPSFHRPPALLFMLTRTGARGMRLHQDSFPSPSGASLHADGTLGWWWVLVQDQVSIALRRFSSC